MCKKSFFLLLLVFLPACFYKNVNINQKKVASKAKRDKTNDSKIIEIVEEFYKEELKLMEYLTKDAVDEKADIEFLNSLDKIIFAKIMSFCESTPNMEFEFGCKIISNYYQVYIVMLEKYLHILSKYIAEDKAWKKQKKALTVLLQLKGLRDMVSEMKYHKEQAVKNN